LGVVIESREPFNFRAPRSFIGGIVHYPGITLETGKGKERFSDDFGTQEKKEFSPVPTGLVEETVKGIFLSWEKGIFGLEEA